MGYSDEEIQKFVEENRDIIEMLMARRDNPEQTAESAERRRRTPYDEERYRIEEDMDRFRDRAEESRYRFEDDLRWARYRADQNRARVEDTFTDVYEAFTDPEVQKCFMTMGFNFVMGMSALMRKMPGPGFAKDAAEGFETSWRKASCSANPDCGVRKKKIEIDDDKPTGAVQIKFDEEE